MDKKTEIINVDGKTLEELVKGSALTFEGLAESTGSSTGSTASPA